MVPIFSRYELIKTHRRARYPSERVTDLGDYPPEKLAYLMAAPSYCRAKGAEYGPFTEKLIPTILSEHAIRNLRKTQGILASGTKPNLGRQAHQGFWNLHYLANVTPSMVLLSNIQRITGKT
jgi:hypothetical protein